MVTNKNLTFSSLKEAASTINSHSKTLSERCNLDLEKGVCVPYRGRYVITIHKDGILSSDHLQKVELARLRGEEGYEAWKTSGGKIVIVTNISTNEIKEYVSVSEVAKAFKISRRTVSRHIESGKVFNELYRFSFK